MSTTIYAITGASRGIGLEFVKQLSVEGNTVIALVRNPDASDRLSALADNRNVHIIKLDITSEDSIKSAANEVSKIAPEGIDVLINNAGLDSDTKTIDITSKAELLRTFETNVTGTNDTIRIFLPLLEKRGQDKIKKILTISSALGSIELANKIGPNGPPTMAAYNVSKAALNMVVKMWAGILGDKNFVVYSSHPGWVKTDMGTESAPLEVYDSVAGLLTVLNKVTSEDNGRFINYNGSPLPW